MLQKNIQETNSYEELPSSHSLYQELLELVGDRNEIRGSGSAEEVQKKYCLDNPQSFISEIVDDGAELQERLYQIDYYLTPAGITPDYNTEYIRFRDDNIQENSTGNNTKDRYELTYKSAGSSLEKSLMTREVKTLHLDEEEALRVMEHLKTLTPFIRKISKERLVYTYKGATLHIDLDVSFADDRFGMNGELGAGSFIELSSSIKQNNSIKNQLLPELSSRFRKATAPYANVEYYINNFSSKDTVQHEDKFDQIEKDPIEDFSFVDFDPLKNSFTKSLDWQRILGDIDKGTRNQISRDPEKQDQLTKAIKNKLNPLLRQMEESDVSAQQIFASGGNSLLTGSLRGLADIDAFSRYKSPKKFLDQCFTLEIRGLNNAHVDGSGTRVFVTVARLKNMDKSVVFLHKLYRTKEDKDYKSTARRNSPAGWINRHST